MQQQDYSTNFNKRDSVSWMAIIDMGDNHAEQKKKKINAVAEHM